MSPSPDLEVATRLLSPLPGRYRLEVPDGWQQGRGAFGGLVFAALVRAVESFSAPEDRALRSLTGVLPGPTFVGGAEITVEPLRVVPSQQTFTAALRQEGEVKAHAVLLYGKARALDAAPLRALTPPRLTPWRELPELPRVEGLSPIFTQHLVFRTDGPYPFSGGAEALAQGWIALREPGAGGAAGLSDNARLAALVDAWWPALWSCMTEARPIATVAFTLQLVQPEAFDPTRPLAYVARAWTQGGGHSIEQRELWSEDGRLVALNQQTIALIR